MEIVYKTGNLEYSFLTISNIDELMNLIEDVYSRIKDKTTFTRDTREEFESALLGKGKIVGVFIDKKLVAYRHMQIVEYQDSLATTINSIQIPKEKIVHHESVVVHEIARGNNIQNISRKILTQTLKGEGYRHFMSTVAPDNYHSLKNVIDSGFVIVGLEDKYPDQDNKNGKKRFVFYKNEEKDLERYGKARIHDLHDYDKISQTLKEKYLGFELKKDDIYFYKVK